MSAPWTRPEPDAPSGGAPIGQRWFDTDVAAVYIGERPGAKGRRAVYRLVRLGMRAVRLDESAHGRMSFCREWIDEFLESRSVCTAPGERTGGAEKPVISADADRPAPEIATRLQRTAAEAVEKPERRA